MTRERVRGLAVAAATALGVIAVAVALFQDDEGPTVPPVTAPATITAPGTVTAPPTTAPAPPVVPEPIAGWGDFEGAPPDLSPPPGGSQDLATGDGAPVLAVRRADGTLLATATLDAEGVAIDARYFDRSGELTLAIAGVRVAGAGAAGRGARVTCGSAASASGGFRWGRFPVRWRLGSARLPPGLSRPRARSALRRAHGTWNANRTHCRTIADRSAVRFAFAGASRRPTGRDGVSLVEFGSVRPPGRGLRRNPRLHDHLDQRRPGRGDGHPDPPHQALLHGRPPAPRR